MRLQTDAVQPNLMDIPGFGNERSDFYLFLLSFFECYSAKLSIIIKGNVDVLEESCYSVYQVR